MKNLTVIALTAWFSVSTGFAQESASQTPQTPQAKSAPAEVPAAKQEKRVSLDAAYKREFAFLQAQKKELEKRLKSYKSQADSEENKIKQKIAGLEHANIDLSAKEDNFKTQLANAERKDDALNDSNELLEMTYSQGNASLENYGLSLEDDKTFADADDAGKLGLLFDRAESLLKELGGIRTQDGRFFEGDGAEVMGKIVKVGNIAAYGIAGDGTSGGILVPAGGGRLKLWSEPAADTAASVLAGTMPENLRIFLYESSDKAVDEKKQKTVLGVIDSGGTIGWAIVVLGAIALVLIIVRWFLLYIASKNTHAIADAVMPMLQRHKKEQALAYCEQQKGPFARLLSATIKNANGNRDHMDDVISEALLHEAGTLNRFGSAILVIASVSPLLGLLGTVTGMISTFDIITEFGTGDPKLLSSGISIALVTTELGLIVAIPSVLAGTLLSSWSEGIKFDLEEVALRAANTLLERQPENDDRPPSDNTKAEKSAPLNKADLALQPEYAVP